MRLPQVFWRESPIQIDVDVSGAFLHCPGVCYEGLHLHSAPPDLRSVLQPEIDEHDAWHLIAMCPPEYRNFLSFRQTNFTTHRADRQTTTAGTNILKPVKLWGRGRRSGWEWIYTAVRRK